MPVLALRLAVRAGGRGARLAVADGVAPGKRGTLCAGVSPMPRTGEEPGPGVYTCTRCGQTVRLDDAGDRLPPCPDCRNTEFVRAGTDPAAAGVSARVAPSERVPSERGEEETGRAPRR